MGAGSAPFEAPYDLPAPIEAGTWHIVADGIVWADCDVTFDLLLRHAAGGEDTTIVTFTHHYVAHRRDDGTIEVGKAVPYVESKSAARVDMQPGDHLIWRHQVSGSTAIIAGAPNGDGPTAEGRFPFIDLPAFER